VLKLPLYYYYYYYYLLGLFMRLWDRRPKLDYGPPQEQQNQVDKLKEGKGREEKGALV
jgi:hypothetical protein